MLSFFLITGVGTNIDPAVCRADGLLGHIIGEVGTLPKIYTEIIINYFLLQHLIGVRNNAPQRQTRVRI